MSKRLVKPARMPHHVEMRRIPAVLALALVAALLPAGAAQAARTVTIKGGGWGHGIGMSQYGAYGRALNGKSAEGILEKYYTGAKVSGANLPARLRVGLLPAYGSSTGKVAFTTASRGEGGGAITIKLKGETQPLAEGAAGDRWRIEASATGGMRIYKNGEKLKRDGVTVFGDPQTPLVLRYAGKKTLVDVENKSVDYALGRMEVGTYASSACGGFCARLVLVIGMQQYLYGLGEVPASWPGAVLRAQAIAGRTYALEKIKRLGRHRDPCDCAVYDSTIDQAYTGDAKRTGSGEYWDDWKAAVDDTKGQVVLYQGEPIQALYSSSSGGHTEHNENVWAGSPIAYLRGVPDGPDSVDANPNHKWSEQMSWSQLSDKLKASFSTGRLERFKLVKPFGVSGRVTVVKSPDAGGVKIVGAQRTVRVDGWDIRSALALKDTLFRVRVSTAGTSAEGTGLGRPLFDLSAGRGFVAERFTNGTLYATDSGTHAVVGAFYLAYRSMGAEAGVLGLPTGAAKGSVQGFTGGVLELAPDGSIAGLKLR